MSIRQRLYLSILLPVLLAIFTLSLILSWSSFRVKNALELDSIVDQIQRGVFEMNIITNDYLLHHEDRAQEQWGLRYASLAELLSKVELNDPAGQVLLDEIVQTHTEIDPLFSDLVETHESHGSDEVVDHGILYVEQLLVAQILEKAQTMVGASMRLADLNRTNLEYIQSRSNLILVILSVFIVIPLVFVIVWTANILIGSIAKLHQGTQIIASGNLEHKVAIDRQDELGDLAQALNQMTTNLRNSLGETAFSKRLLMTFSQIAHEVLRAHSLEDVYKTVSNEVSKLGYSAAVFVLDDDKNRLIIPYLGYKPELLIALEKTTGMKAKNYSFSLSPDGIHQKLIKGGEAVYIDPYIEPIREALPSAIRPLASKVASLAGIKQGILVPLIVNGDTHGLLVVTGSNLTEDDLTVMKAFANQTTIALENARLYEQLQGELAERKIMQQRIADALKFNQTIIGASSLGISVYQESGQCILTNDAMANIIGATREQVLAQNFHEIESWKKSGLYEAAKEALASQSETRHELHTESSFGKEVWLECRFTPVISGEESHMLLMVDDTSVRKRAEEALRAYTAVLEQSNRDLEEFTYIASHDLQEPLRKILAFGDRLMNGYGDTFDETGRDFMLRLHRATKRMQTMINDLLVYSRVSTQSQPLSQMKLTEVAKSVVSTLKPEIKKMGGRVEIDSLPSIEADLVQVKQLLGHLLDNSLKFHQEGIPPKIKISGGVTKQDGPSSNEVCQVVVEDNGIGFDPQFSQRIFKPFQRLHKRGEYDGSGMGLAICRRIVERHGGSIVANSTPGQGATIMVTLPIRQNEGERVYV